MPPIAWLPWRAESFARARAAGRPVLLSIVPGWCPHSRMMDRTTYADTGISDLVLSRFVPIRVDPNRRPDIGERYGLGGWPTTVFLTPEGRIIGGGTYVETARLADVLPRVANAFSAGRHLIAPQRRYADRIKGGDSPASGDLLQLVFQSFDATNGGFGGAPKFPHAAPVRLAMGVFRQTGSRHGRDMAVKSLDAIGWGPLRDERHGGFFSYARGRDWTGPGGGKLLDVNASLLTLYVEAFETFGLARYAECAESLLRFTQSWLADPVDGGWSAWQFADPDDDGVRQGDSVVEGRALDVDPTLYSDWNGRMVSAALRAAGTLDDRSLAEFAINSLEHVLMLGYKPGAGMAHCTKDGEAQVRGLLLDQVEMAAACLDAYEATGSTPYEMMAQELAAYAIRTMWDEEAGGFWDRIVDPRRDVGLLKEPLKVFTANCTAVRVLRRLASVPECGDFARYAERTLAAMSARATAQGPLAAEYLLALPPQERR